MDIKTQITLNDFDHIETAVVAIPMLEPENLTFFIVKTLGAMPDNLIINGTGTFKTHSSVADCGVTGRKLACDFMAHPLRLVAVAHGRKTAVRAM